MPSTFAFESDITLNEAGPADTLKRIVDRHRIAEETSLALHRLVADKLEGEPSLLERARARVRLWRETGQVHPFYAEQWASVLERPIPEIRALLMEDSETARALRQMTPFAGAIDARTRWRTWRAHRAPLAPAAR